MAVPDCVMVLAAISTLVSIWAYMRARKLHFAIEEFSPGFNAVMRCKWRRGEKRR